MNQKIIRTALALLFLSALIAAPYAQPPPAAAEAAEDRVALFQALLDLTNPWTVMCIAAHPDDEDGTSLIVMRRKYGAHTVSLFSTFGEGGQNAIGPELYEELGAIRARETMAAAEIQGSEPHFLGLRDFGYSKSADEAFRFWGHDEALRRMVFEIRKLRPDVIITNHSVTSNDHGHHQATARLVVEAFDAAADPKRFPEQLKDGVTTWQVQRLFVRVRGNAQAQADSSPVVTIDPNEQDPVRGVVYAEEALRALQKHATQGPWPKTFAEFAARFRAFTGQSATPGQLPLIRYRLVREAKGTDVLTKDSHNFLDGLRLPDEIAKRLAPPINNGRPLTDSAGNRSLVYERLQAYRFLDVALVQSADAPRYLYMWQRRERALALAAGVSLTVAPSVLAIPNSTAEVPIKIANGGTQAVGVLHCSPPTVITQSNQTISRNGVNEAESLKPGATLNRYVPLGPVPDKMPPNIPLASHLYEPNALGMDILIICSIQLTNVRISLQASTRLNVAPPVEIESVTPSPFVITPGTASHLQSLVIKLINRRNESTAGKLVVSTKTSRFGELKTQPGFSLGRGETGFSLARGETREVKVVPSLEPGLIAKGQTSPEDAFTFSIASLTDGKGESGQVQRTVRLAYADARAAPNLSVGYLRGFDLSLPNALNALGVESKELSVDEVKTANLSKYTSIIIDNRVYESQPELIAANQKLLDFSNAGGTLIVFYHKSDEWNPDARRNRPQLAPYKLILGNERITDENAPVTFIEPQHPLLNVPNKMGQEDFTGWIQERGLYYPREWDPQFHALLQSNDPAEAPLKGGLLVADYGRGHYIYTSMVWYRQLRAGVPGAYRMFANMISYGH